MGGHDDFRSPPPSGFFIVRPFYLGIERPVSYNTGSLCETEIERDTSQESKKLKTERHTCEFTWSKLHNEEAMVSEPKNVALFITFLGTPQLGVHGPFTTQDRIQMCTLCAELRIYHPP